MKHLLITLFFAIFIANFANAQVQIQFVDWGCDNGDQTRYLMTEPNQFTVRVEVSEMPEGTTGYFRCVLNGEVDVSQSIPVNGNGLYTITYDSVGLGNPDHTIAISIWDGVSVVLSNDLSLENINVWTWAPDLIDLSAIYDGEEVVMGVTATGFLLPHGSPGNGGCTEHQLVLISQVNSPEVGGVYYHRRIMEEDFGSESFQDSILFVNNSSEDVILCSRYFVRMEDMSEMSSEPDFEPVQITSTESVCITLPGDITTGTLTLSDEALAPYPNPFTDQVNIGTRADMVTIHTASGGLVYHGPGGVVNTGTFAPGIYVARTNNRFASRIVKQ
jgi:hypothetical protein